VEVGGVVTQVVTGMLHTCALLEGGRVRCWGASSYGQLGYGTTESIGDDETPASAGDVQVGGVVKQLAAGAFATCALLENGHVRCWGDGEMGELGYGNLSNIGDDELPSAAGDVDVGGLVTHLDMGFLHVCATLESGAVRCWGRGATAALGYGNLKNIGDDEAPATAGDLSLF
jgi:alpha-tubulin suppressor-like RCC1 family protein